MVDHSERSTHHIYLSDTIEFQPSARYANRAEIASMYLEGLSLAQIAENLGHSKSFIFASIRDLRVLRPKKNAQTNPANYRKPIPPYGYRVRDGKLVGHKAELKVCRLIVDLMGRHGLTSVGAARHLTEKGVRNRRGTTSWHNHTVGRIYQRWKGKL